jgi:hypothetical protein
VHGKNQAIWSARVGTWLDGVLNSWAKQRPRSDLGPIIQFEQLLVGLDGLVGKLRACNAALSATLANYGQHLDARLQREFPRFTLDV